VTNGARQGTSGSGRWPDWAIAYAILAVATLLFAIVNVLSFLDERAAMARPPIPWWEPAVWEGTSGIVLLALAWMPMLIAERLPPEGPRWPLAIAAQLAMTVPFSLIHVALMIGLRKAAYALAGEHYEFGGGGLLYEYRKDLLSYAIYAATYWIVRRLRMRGAGQEQAPEPDLFDIDEGQRLIRVARPEILCARSSGNYVEFFLADGRRPLMRTTLASVEAMLAGAGFVRTHKSWLANPAHVVEIVAEGSGDHGLRLTDGTQLPLSRRYPEALAALRAGRAN
jgi:LytTr DNA-binding domain